MEFVLFYTTNLKKFFANNFFGYTFFQLFPRIWNQRKILHFYTHIQKKKQKNLGVIVYINEH